MPTSRSAVAAVLAAGILATPALGQDLALPRQKIELVAPPLVHPHEQATTDTPKILQFKLVTREKQIVIDPAGNLWVGNNWQNFDAVLGRVAEPLSTLGAGQGVVVFYGMAKPVRTPLIGPARPAK